MIRRVFLLLFAALLCVQPILAQHKDLKNKLGSVNKKKKEVASALRQMRRKANIIKEDIQTVDNQLNNLEVKLENTTNQLQQHKSEQEVLQIRLRKATLEVEQTRILARARMKQMYMQGEDTSVLDLFLARDLGDLAARKDMVSRIASRDKEVFGKYSALQKEIAAKKRRKDQLVAEVGHLIVSQKDQQDELEDTRVKKAGTLKQLQAQQKDLERQYHALDAESDAIAAQIRRMQAASSHSGSAPKYAGGRMSMPASGRLSSGFGWRFHPILHKQKFHNGLDIAAGYGSGVHAAADGVVLIAGYGNGYGNRIIIDHGNGISTLYGHLSRVGVSSGTHVKRGQYIGAVGSTGLSTGPHLHFEVRRNGNPVNPRPYL